MDIDKWQVHMAAAWKKDVEQTHLGFTDATCYESYVTYPTDAKLIWKWCNEVFIALKILTTKPSVFLIKVLISSIYYLRGYRILKQLNQIVRIFTKILKRKKICYQYLLQQKSHRKK